MILQTIVFRITASVRTLVATAIPTFQVPSAAFLIFDAIQFFCTFPKGSSELDGVSDATISENHEHLLQKYLNLSGSLLPILYYVIVYLR